MTVRAARLTPPGTGAVATIAVVGTDAWPIIYGLFQARRRLSIDEPPSPGSILYGNFGEPPGDEVVVTVRPAIVNPWYEIHCHGGPQIVAWLLEQIEQRGAAIVDWTELESLNCRDTLSAAAMKLHPHALTTRAAQVLLEQYHGALAMEVAAIIGHLESRDFVSADQQLKRLQSYIGVGSHLTRPWRVALCGPPNAGKSSLVNALAGFRRAVVTPTPGTTRDVVSTLVAFDGWPVELLDTAGIRTAADHLENIGMELGMAAARDADLVLWITEPSHPMAPPASFSNVLVVSNKCDLASDQSNQAISVSATTGVGLDRLMSAIVAHLIPLVPPPKAAVPITEAIGQAITAALCSIQAGDLDAAFGVLRPLISPADSA
jgi:tRNA modification GTPase